MAQEVALGNPQGLGVDICDFEAKMPRQFRRDVTPLGVGKRVDIPERRN